MTINSRKKFKLFVATSTRENPGPFKDQEFAYAWAKVDAENYVIAGDSNPFGDSGSGDHTKGTFPAIRAGIATIDDHADVEVICLLAYVNDLLNGSIRARRENGYLRSNKRPLADKADLMALDDELERRSITISGRRPNGLAEEIRLGKLQSWAYEKARNIGVAPGDWNL